LHNYQRKIFRFFEPFPAHWQAKCSKSGDKSKKILLIKIQYGYQKFHADFQSVEKVLTKYTKKKLLAKKTLQKYAHVPRRLFFAALQRIAITLSPN
jgi:hypothetical protein